MIAIRERFKRDSVVIGLFILQVVLTIAVLVGLVVNLSTTNRRASQDLETQIRIGQQISRENQDILRQARAVSQENQAILREVVVSQRTFLCIVLLPFEDRTPGAITACEEQAREGGGI